MKSILLIGLGRFGKHIAIHLNHLKHQVMAVDIVEERVDNVLPYVTNAQIGDSTNPEFMESLGVRNFDVCIVAGNNIPAQRTGSQAGGFQSGQGCAGQIPPAQRRG